MKKKSYVDTAKTRSKRMDHLNNSNHWAYFTDSYALFLASNFVIH